jgi:hypothetical protein
MVRINLPGAIGRKTHHTTLLETSRERIARTGAETCGVTHGELFGGCGVVFEVLMRSSELTMPDSSVCC